MAEKEGTAEVQETIELKPGVQETAGGEIGSANDTATDAQPEDKAGSETVDALEKKDLPPELQTQQKELLRAFHAKTKALADKEKDLTATAQRYEQDAKVLYDLGKQDWFKKAIETEKVRRSGAHIEVSAEDFEAIKSDPKAFQTFLAQRDRALADSIKSEFKVEFDKLNKNQQELVTTREFETVAENYGDEFTQANESGGLEPYLKDGLDYERSFKLYMADQGKVARKTGEQTSPERKKAGVIERGGMATVRGGPVYKAKNLNEALDRAFDLARKGTKEYRLVKE